MRKIRGEEAIRMASMLVYFVPQPDITTYELAFIVRAVATGPLGMLSGIGITKQQFDELPPQVSRHFSLTQDKGWKGDAPAQANTATGPEPQA